MQHEITISTEIVGTGERHRAVCSCGAYRSTSSHRLKRDAERAGWQHQRRLGVPVGKPGSTHGADPARKGNLDRGGRIGE